MNKVNLGLCPTYINDSCGVNSKVLLVRKNQQCKTKQLNGAGSLFIHSLLFLLLSASLATPTLGYAAAGELDPSFGVGGLVQFEEGSSIGNNSVFQQPDGKLVVATSTSGHDESGAEVTRSALSRFNRDGSPDLTFGVQGEADVPFPSVKHIALQNGKLLVVGPSEAVLTMKRAIFNVARFNANGTVDTSFGTAGALQLDLTPSTGVKIVVGDSQLAILNDGSFILAVGVDKALKLSRYLPDGQVDTRFGNKGFVLTSINAGGDFTTPHPGGEK